MQKQKFEILTCVIEEREENCAEDFENFLNSNEEDKSEKMKSTDYNTTNKNIWIKDEETNIEPTLEETITAIISLRNHRVPGENKITAEFIKYEGNEPIKKHT
ncbi:hypothetical protein CWI36_0279p0010 [Hamiltosporidium magnivora]|uniref:Uncharacterized protein n=1 Tax=Hamiltosporidium magnivora TaxID=148818 RepID=A0A4Q9LHG0_9MICR|nr:hypothetical protein CWI36_0580p0010 [Hamiltosporidium magnivora]TBU07407.1 hypothetical protein CWI36_0279p0010 [Hamiltosporidium magnivora]